MKTKNLRLLHVLLCSLILSAAMSLYASAYPVKKGADFKLVSSEDGTSGYTADGKWSENVTAYHKLTIEDKYASVYVTGLENGSQNTTYGMYIALCDAGRHVLDASTGNGTYVKYVKDSPIGTGFAVKKGTYYIRVTGAKNYRVIVVTNKWKDKSKTKKSKAATVKRKKAVKGAFLAGEKPSTSDWFKFKLTKKKAVTLYADFSIGNGRYAVLIKTPRNKTTQYINGGQSLYWKSTGKWSKGTYYIRFKRLSDYERGSAAYTFKWK